MQRPWCGVYKENHLDPYSSSPEHHFVGELRFFFWGGEGGGGRWARRG